MLALDAEIHAEGAEGRRATVKATDFFQDLFTRGSARRTRSSSACSSRRCKPAAYAKLHQRASHYAIVGVAAALDVKGGVIQSARIGLTGATTHAMRLTGVEQALAGKKADGDRGGGRSGGERRRRRQRRPARERGVSTGDDSGVRAGGRWRRRSRRA